MAGTGETRRPAEGSQALVPRGFQSFDGPSDNRSADTQPAHGFGRGMGFDPARDNPGPDLPRRLELPSAAYIDPTRKYFFPEDLPQRPANLNTLGTEIQIRVNQFKVLEWPSKTVFQYDVMIGSGTEKRGLITAVWLSRAVQEKITKLDDFWLFDGNRIAWCSKDAGPKELRIDVDLDREKGRLPRMNPVNGLPMNIITLRIKRVSQIRMAVIGAYLSKQMAFDTSVLEAINFLDHCMRQMPSQEYTLIKRSFFSRIGTRVTLDNAIEAMKGVYSSIRLCQPVGSFGTSTGLAVNLDVANGTFWSPNMIADSVRAIVDNGRCNLPFEELCGKLKPVKFLDRWTMSPALKELRKFSKIRFTVKHRGKMNETKIYTIKDFYFDEKYAGEGANAKNVTFPYRDKSIPDSVAKDITIHDYFLKQYNIYLNLWYLPLVRTTKDGYFPMEVCNIAPNQVYRFKCTSEQTAKMIKFAVTRPKERMESVRSGIAMLKWHKDPFLRHYGIKIDPNMTVTKARVLPSPEVHFNGAKVNPGTTGRWDLRGKRFFRGGVKLESWGVCALHGTVDKATLDNFLKIFIQTYTGHGGSIPAKDPFLYFVGKNEDLAPAVEATRRGAGNKFQRTPQIIFFILPSKLGPTYERLKKNMECRWGLFSQMMQAVHVRTGNPQYCSNVSMKVNAKLGGATSSVVAPPGHAFKEPTMIIGADVSHPSPGSPQASMAAMTMSMDREALRYAAAVQTNGHRVEMISTINIRYLMLPLLQHWITAVGGGRPPTHIYYFRDGVSEGQYSHVLEQEVKDMKDAILDYCTNTQPEFKDVKVKFTVIVASKRHHLRFFPKEGEPRSGDRNGNILPGTLVERDVTHPFEYDFYLSSHSAIQGTARPTHYHVLMDEANLSPNLFHKMIYQQCYTYMRSTTPVSLHPAVYYAHLASNRARAHEDMPFSSGPRGGQKFVEQEQDKAIHAAMRGVEPSHHTPLDRHTEAKPLVPLAYLCPEDANVTLIRTGMWYI